MQTAFLPIGVPTFDLVAAQKEFDDSVALIKKIDPNAAVPGEMLLSLDKLNSFMDGLDPDLIVMQNITFANSAYCTAIISRFPECPVVLWTLAEPAVDGARLRLNSLTGAYSAANCMKSLGKESFEYVYGGPEEEGTERSLGAFFKAAQLRKKLCSTTMAAVGHTPEGFGFGRALDSEMMRFFGVRLMSIEARELMDKARSFDASSCSEYRKFFEKRCEGFENLPQNNIDDFLRLLRAYDEFIKQNKVDLLSSRCWPDFFTSYGTPVCAVLSLLNDMGISSACESDSYGSLSMYVASFFSGGPVFFGDPVHLDRKNGTVTYWHCGMAPSSLACGLKAQIGVHPNRRIGPVMDFACKGNSEVTVFRIGRLPDASFRVFIAAGKAIECPKQFIGTSVVVKTSTDASELIDSSVRAGWEPHFVVAYGDIRLQLEAWARMTGLKIEIY